MLPGAKVTPEIAAIRGIPVGVDCKSPAGHTAFHDVDGHARVHRAHRRGDRPARRHQVGGGGARLLGRPHPAHGGHRHRPGLHHHRRRRGRHRRGPAQLRRPRRRSRSGGASPACTGRSPSGVSPTARSSSARAGSASPRPRWPPWPSAATWSNVGRTAMFSIGCIQAQRCHTDRCPTGRRHPEPPADARPRPRAQVGAVRQLPGVGALRAGAALPGVRGRCTRPS